MIARRTLPLLAAGLALPAAAQEFPARSLRLVIPFTPGGGTDVLARRVAEGMSAQLGQRVVPDNRPGAGGNVGAEIVARAAPDGHELLLATTGPLVINISLFRRLSYDPIESFEPVAMLGELPNVLVVNPSVPARDLAQFIALAREAPGRFAFASSGNGSSTHLSGVMFNALTGARLTHVPYAGNAPALNDVVGGHIPAAFVDVLTARPFIEEGRMRALGVTTAARSNVLPNVPTIAEQGFPGFETSVAFALLAPRGTPAPVLERLNRAVQAAAAEPAFQAFLASQGILGAKDMSRAWLAAWQRREIPRWRELVQGAGAQVD